MKIYLGHPVNENSKVSAALKDTGVSLLRAQPSEIELHGLYQKRQRGYEIYSLNLPAFIFATLNVRTVALSGTEYPISTKFQDLLPTGFPLTFVHCKRNVKLSEIYKGEADEFMTTKDGVSYVVPFTKELVYLAKHSKVDANKFCNPSFVRLVDLPAMIILSRIISGFLRTHKFPAFNDAFHYENFDHDNFDESIKFKDSVKHGILYDTEGAKKRQYVEANTPNGPIHGYFEKSYDDANPSKIVYDVAKPVKGVVIPWGGPNQIPTTDGIHFPYSRDLSKPDKRTTLEVMKTYFVRCFNKTTDLSLQSFEEVSRAWLSSIHRTPWGQEISHLCKVIQIGIPAQARIFPVIENNVYLGCYLSGAAFSVAQRRTIIRPESYAINFLQTDCYGSDTTLFQQLSDILDPEAMSLTEELKTEYAISFRSLCHKVNRDFTITEDEKDKVIKILCKVNHRVPYKNPTAANIAWFVQGLRSGEMPDMQTPMYPGSTFKTDIYHQYLSAFGVLVPSPDIPSAPLIPVTQNLPEKFSKIVGLRLVYIDQAIEDWKRVGTLKKMRNGVNTLSAPYEHSALTGEEAKKLFFQTMYSYVDWFQEVNKGNIDVSKVVEDGGDAIVRSELGDFVFDGF